MSVYVSICVSTQMSIWVVMHMSIHMPMPQVGIAHRLSTVVRASQVCVCPVLCVWNNIYSRVAWQLAWRHSVHIRTADMCAKHVCELNYLCPKQCL